MRKQLSFTLVEILIVLAAIATATGGILIWQKRAPVPTFPTLSPLPKANTTPMVTQSPTQLITLSPTVALLTSPLPTQPRYQVTCPSGQVPIYEGGEFSGCEEPARIDNSKSCGSDNDCVLKDRYYCCGERLESYKWCYHRNVEPEKISCKGIGSCPGIAGSARSCVCQNGKCAAIF